MAIDFPNSPTVGQEFTASGRSWQWDGSAWKLVAAGLPGPTGPAGPTGPTGPAGQNGDWTTTQTIVPQTGTTYVPTSSDAGKLVTLSNSSAITVTINSSLGLSTGGRIDFAQTGTGQVTFQGSSVTLNATPGLKLRAQHSVATLVCISSNNYLLVGDLSA